ncbi:MAG: DUF1284 domain-containing protein [Methanobacterium sp.]|uniref:DUF1284 domain-containing protein n=1 Tax=Methanobacterium sp. TaxID=2164 RepID=UPI003D653BD5|nr:DUF1284 domain-containing protein [Methanobacterium sp.]
MQIRAHHLLCLQGFQGHGYSEEFSINMGKIVKIINSNPQQEIEIITNFDAICSCCPNNRNEKCKNLIFDWMIKKTDEKILKKIELDNGTFIKADDAFSLVNERFKTFNDAKKICRNCSWRDKCLWFISRLK